MKKLLLAGVSVLALSTGLLTPSEKTFACENISGGAPYDLSSGCILLLPGDPMGSTTLTSINNEGYTNNFISFYDPGNTFNELVNEGTLSLDPLSGKNSNGLYVLDRSTITTFINTSIGTIRRGNVAIYLGGGAVIGSISNAGVLSGGSGGIFNLGTIGGITNDAGATLGVISNYGTIGRAGNIAISNSGYIVSSIVNAAACSSCEGGVISGTIIDNSSRALTIVGGGGSGNTGTLTGGTISVLNNLVISGNQWLDDAYITVGTYDTVSMTGTVGTVIVNSNAFTISQAIKIDGNYLQTGDATNLIVGKSAGQLSVTGKADIENQIINIVGDGSWVVGTTYTLASGASGSVYKNNSVLYLPNVDTNPTYFGLATQSGNDLLLVLSATQLACTSVSTNYAYYLSSGCLVLSSATLGQVGLGGTQSSTIMGTITGAFVTQGTTGRLNLLSNTGTITAIGTHIGVSVKGFISTFNNSGTILSAGTILNGTMQGGIGIVVANTGTISRLSNTGTISGINAGIVNSGTIGQIINTSTGSINTIVNSGLIGGATNSLAFSNSGTINFISNTGTISGNIFDDSGRHLTLQGDTNSFAVLTGGRISIGNSADGARDLVLNKGYQYLNDANITVATLNNQADLLKINQSVTVVGDYSQTAGDLYFSSGAAKLSVTGVVNATGAATIDLSGYMLGSGQASATFTLIQGGAGSDYSNYVLNKFENDPSRVKLQIETVDSTYSNLLLILSGDLITCTSLNSMSSYDLSSGCVSLQSTIPSSSVTLTGSITNIIISSGYALLAAGQSLGTINNQGTLTMATEGSGILIEGHLGTLSNAGAISGAGTAIKVRTSGNLCHILNTGILSGGDAGINNQGSICQISNISVTGSIGTINAIVNTGVIGIGAGAVAISNSGSIGLIKNSGIINGSIIDTSGMDLTIQGADSTSTGFGTLTGGSISVGKNLVISSDNLYLNTPTITANTVINQAAVLQISQPITITGNYVQTLSNTNLYFSTSKAELIVDGVAILENATISIGSRSHLGTYTLVSATGSSSTYDTDSLQLSWIGGTDGNSLTTTIDTDTGNNNLLVVLTKIAPYWGEQGQAIGGGSAPALGASLDTLILNASAPDSFYDMLDRLRDLQGAAFVSGFKQLAPPNLSATQLSSNQAMLAATNKVIDHVGNILTDIDYNGSNKSPLLGLGAAHFGLYGLPISQTGKLQPNSLRSASLGQGIIDQTMQSLFEDSIDEGDEVQTGDVALKSKAKPLGNNKTLSTWLTPYGGFARQGDQGADNGYKDTYYGMVGGIDKVISGNIVTGMALSWNQSSITGNTDLSGNNLLVTSYQGYLYGGIAQKILYMSFLGGGSYDLYQGVRSISFAGQTAKSSFSGIGAVGRAELGLNFKLDSTMTLSPLIGMAINYGKTNAYSETNSVDAYSIASQHSTNLTQSFGVKYRLDQPSRYGLFILDAKAEMVHNSVNAPENNPITTNANQYGVGLVTTAPTAPNFGLRESVGMGLKLKSNLTVGVSYEGEQMRPQYINNVLMFNVKKQF